MSSPVGKIVLRHYDPFNKYCIDKYVIERLFAFKTVGSFSDNDR